MIKEVKVIEKLIPIYQPNRYKILFGGRASGKSIAVADFLLLQTAYNKKRVLCCREYQASIKDSVHRVLCDRIEVLGLSECFEITRDEIRSKAGSNFIFKGLAQHYAEIKSTEGIDYCWCEEAERVSEQSWEVLIPTIRNENSEILITFNPSNEKASTYQRFVVNKPENSVSIKINYYDNPFLPKVLLQEIDYDKQYNPEKFRHIWEGECATISDSIVFKNKFTVQPFNIDLINGNDYFKDKPISYRHGLDFGFSIDPTASVECFIQEGNLYITNELCCYKLETDDIIPKLKEFIPHALKSKIFADGSRPETISQLSRRRMHSNGEWLEALNIEAAIKGKNSVIEGIEYIKNFKQVIIHPKCKNTIFEFESYSYKQDKDTGDIFKELVDKHNHCLTGNMIVNTSNGNIRIDELVGKEGYVWSYNEETQKVELNKFFDVRQTRIKEVYKMELIDGRIIEATGNHKVLTKRGWIETEDLTENDFIMDISQSI